MEFVLLIDESDLIEHNCILLNNINIYKRFDITATPHLKKINDYDNILINKFNNQYYGLEKFNLTFINNDDEIYNYIDLFIKSKPGYFMNNCYKSIKLMKFKAKNFSKLYPNIPIILLSCNKYVYFNGKRKKFNNNISLDKIFEYYNNYNHLIIIANRLASRGISFRYKNKHITFQYVKVNKSYNNFIQSLRMSGNYNNIYEKLNLILSSNDQKILNRHIKIFNKINKLIYNYNNIIM